MRATYIFFIILTISFIGNISNLPNIWKQINKSEQHSSDEINICFQCKKFLLNNSCLYCDYVDFLNYLDLRNNHICKDLNLSIPKYIFNVSEKISKPVIYVYPKKQISVTINLNINKGKLTVVYPKFNLNNNTWKINANPNGDIEINNRKYPYLFYECESYFEQDTNEGFIVDDKNAEKFLEEKLKILGLNDKEMTDFITYWLPTLLNNKLSICSFQTQNFLIIFN